MLLDEKKNLEQQDNSNNENDFKELDNEITKVIRGETLLDEEKNEKNNIDNSISNHSHNSNEINNDKKDNSNLINQNQNNNNINNKIKNNTIDEEEMLKKMKNKNQSFKNESKNLNKYPNNKNSSLNYNQREQLNTNNLNFNEISNNLFQNKNLTNFQGINIEEYIASNTSRPSNEYNNMNNLYHNLNQANINDFCFPQNNFNQFNFFKTNEYNLQKNINNLGLYNICNINNLFNNEHLETKNEINNNQIFNPYFSLNNNQLIGNYNFYSQNKNQENPLFNTYNKINNNNYINNFININIPMIQNNYNQLFSLNEMNSNILNNKINNNIFNNNISNNINENKNCFFINNNGVNDNNNSYNNIKDSNLHYNKEEIVLNHGVKKRDNQKKNNKKNMDLFSINNSKINNSKKYHSNKNVNSFYLDKNILSNKRKIFNPIPDSEKEKNIINLLDILQCKDMRTTLMIKNIPNKYTISSLLNEINEYFNNTYDIFYLPIDYINKCNLGFAFINFVEPLHIILFYELYKGKKWKKFNSEKICELLYAKLQGKKELISHFEKGKVLSFENEDKRPLILNTPNPLPKINIPFYYLNIFIKLYPKISFEIKELKNNNDKNDYSLKQIFSINGNFKNN